MQKAAVDRAWCLLDAIYHDFDDVASDTVRSMAPDDQNDVLWLFGVLLKGCMLGTEARRGLEPGEGLRVLRSQFRHPSEGPACG